MIFDTGSAVLKNSSSVLSQKYGNIGNTIYTLFIFAILTFYMIFKILYCYMNSGIITYFWNIFENDKKKQLF